MNYRNASAPARPVSRTLAAIGKISLLTAALAMATASLAVAQQAAPATAAKPKPPAKKPG